MIDSISWSSGGGYQLRIVHRPLPSCQLVIELWQRHDADLLTEYPHALESIRLLDFVAHEGVSFHLLLSRAKHVLATRRIEHARQRILASELGSSIIVEVAITVYHITSVLQ